MTLILFGISPLQFSNCFALRRVLFSVAVMTRIAFVPKTAEPVDYLRLRGRLPGGPERENHRTWF